MSGGTDTTSCYRGCPDCTTASQIGQACDQKKCTDRSTKFNCQAPFSSPKLFLHAAENVGTVTHRYRDLTWDSAYPQWCIGDELYSSCTLAYVSGTDNTAKMTMASDGSTTIDLANSLIGVGVYKITCQAVPTPLGLNPTITASTITQEVYDKCTWATITPGTKTYNYEVNQNNGVAQQMKVTEAISSFFSITNNTHGCQLTICKTDFGCGTDYPQISESFDGTNLALSMKTDLFTGGSKAVCLQCLNNNNKLPLWYQTTINFNVQYLCASQPRIIIGTPIADKVVYTSNPTSLTGQQIVSQTTTNDAVLCPITSASLFNADNTAYTGNLISINAATGQVTFQGNSGVTAQAVKVRITTTLGNIIDSGTFFVKVYNCANFITVPTVLNDYSQTTINPGSLSGNPLFAGFSTSDPVNCPISSVTLMQNPASPAVFTSSCVNVNPSTGQVTYKGVVCALETQLFVRVTSNGGTVVQTTPPFQVQVIIDCTPHLSVNTLAAAYSRTEALATSVQNVVILPFSTTFLTAEPVNCRITAVAILNTDNSPYDQSCALVDPGLNVIYKGTNFCVSTGLKIKLTTDGGVGYTHINSQLFNVSVIVDCTTHLLFPTTIAQYELVVTAPTDALIPSNLDIISAWTSTGDPINCPITAFQLINAGDGSLYTGNCTQIAQVTSTQHKVVWKGIDFCQDTGIKIKLNTNGGIGYTATNPTPFNVRLKVNCTPNLGTPTWTSPPNPLHYRFVPDSNDVLGETFVSGSGFTSVYNNFCPVTSPPSPPASFALFQGSPPPGSSVAYSGNCVEVDTSGNFKFKGQFCSPAETNLFVEMTVTGVQTGDIYKVYSSVFDAEVKVNCTPHVLPTIPQKVFFRDVANASSLLGQTLMKSHVTMDAINCPLVSFQILQNGAAYTGTCIVVDGSGNVNFNGQFCEEDNFQIEVTSAHGQTNTTNAFKVFVKPYCPPNLNSLNLLRDYINYTTNATQYSENIVIFNGSNHFVSSDSVNCPILSYELTDFTGTPYSGSCVKINNTTGSLRFNDKFCREENLRVRLNSKFNESILSEAFDVELIVDCTPHIHYLWEGMPRIFNYTARSRQKLTNQLMLSGYFESTEPKACPINYWKLKHYHQDYPYETNITCIKIDSTTGYIRYTGDFCHQFNISVQFGTTWGKQAFNETPFFDVLTTEQEKVKFMKNRPPFFSGSIPSLGIEINETDTNPVQMVYHLKLPDIVDDKQELWRLDISSTEFGKLSFENKTKTSQGKLKLTQERSTMLSFDPETLVITVSFKSKKQLYQFEGENALQFTLIDRDDTAQSYSTGVVIRIFRKIEEKVFAKPKPIDDGRYVSARIRGINHFGEMTINFSHKMRTINPNITLAHINDTFIDMYIVPSGDWHLTKKNFKMEWLNFTWNVTHYGNSSMHIKLWFKHPLQVSPNKPQDRLVFHIREKFYFFFSSELRRDLHDNFTTLDFPVSRQLEDNEFNRRIILSAEETSLAVTWSFVVQSSMNIFLNSLVQKILRIISSLQIVLHLPLHEVAFPANVQAIFQTLLPIAQFDLLESFHVMENFYPESQEDALRWINLIQNTREIGYESFNLLMNLGIFSIAIICYVCLLIFYLVWVYPRRKKNLMYRRWYQKMRYNVFYGMVVSITLGGYFEILIASYLSLLSPEQSIDNVLQFTVTSLFFGWISAVFLPCATLHLMLLPLDELAKRKTREKWGMYFLEIDPRSSWKQLHQIVFLFRRILFVSIAFLLLPMGGLQMVLFNILNMFVFEAFSLLRPLVGKFRNDIETFNEFMIGMIMITCFCFSDFCNDEVYKYNMGWFMLILVAIILTISFSIVVWDFARFIYLSLIRHQIPHLFNVYITGPFEYWWTPLKIATPGRSWLEPKKQQFPMPVEVQPPQPKKAKKKVKAKNSKKGKKKAQQSKVQVQSVPPKVQEVRKPNIVFHEPPSAMTNQKLVRGRKEPSSNNPFLAQRNQLQVPSQPPQLGFQQKMGLPREDNEFNAKTGLGQSHLLQRRNFDVPDVITKPAAKQQQFQSYQAEPYAMGQEQYLGFNNSQLEMLARNSQQPTRLQSQQRGPASGSMNNDQPAFQTPQLLLRAQPLYQESPSYLQPPIHRDPPVRHPSPAYQDKFSYREPRRPEVAPVQPSGWPNDLFAQPQPLSAAQPPVHPSLVAPTKRDLLKEFEEQLKRDKLNWDQQRQQSSQSSFKKLEFNPLPLPPAAAPAELQLPLQQPDQAGPPEPSPSTNINFTNLVKLIDQSKAKNQRRMAVFRKNNILRTIQEDSMEQ